MIAEPGSNKYLPLIACNDTRENAVLSYRAWDADSGEILASGSCPIPANQNWQVAKIRSFASDRRMILLHWEFDQVAFGSHFLTGSPPFNLEYYKNWLKQISSLPRTFQPAVSI
jgi:hypothetical protein